MNIHLTLRRAVTAAAALAVAALLSGCVIASKDPIVPASEAVAAFGDNLPFISYEGTGPYTKSTDATFGGFAKAADSNVYADPTGALKVTFVPHGEGKYLLAVDSKSDSGEVGHLYGIALVKNDIMATYIILGTDPGPQLEAAGVAVPAGATIDGGGVMVTDRASLDAVIDLLDKGTIKTDPLISYVGSGEAPATIVADGDWYKAQ
jgi:hypothetical protein